MSCLICPNEGRPQRIYLIGRWVMRMLCDPCANWISGEIPAPPS